MLSLALLLVALEPQQGMPWGGTDYVQYHVAAELMLGGKNPYDRQLTEARQVHYGRGEGVATFAPPWSLLTALPFSGLSFDHAVFANLCLNALLLIVAVSCWAWVLFPRNLLHIPLILPASVIWIPTLAVLGVGQLSAWPFVGFAGWLWFTTRKRHVPAALFLVLTIFKPHLGLLPGLFVAARWLRRKQWLPMLVFVTALLCLTLLTFWLRPSIWSDYYTSLQSGITPDQIETATFDSWARSHLGKSYRLFSWGLFGCGVVAAVVTGWMSSGNTSKHADDNSPKAENQTLVTYSAFVCAVSLATVPYAFSFDYIFLLPGFILAVGRTLSGLPYWQWSLAAWLGLDIWLIAAKQAPWREAEYWFVPMLGLAVTGWVLYLQSRSSPVGVRGRERASDTC